MQHDDVEPPEGTPRVRALWDSALKRAVDVCVAGAGLTLSAPVMAVVAGAIYADMGAPVLYRQVRPGYRGRPIRIWKFRTMTNERGEDGQLLPDAERLTSLGRLLRELSLDELPQLANVLTGEMSLVGPRPLLVRYLPRYSPRQRLRLWAKPGITGWAQINGRNAVDWKTRLELDAWYVEHQSLLLDLKILLATASKVLARDDVLAGAGAEFGEFWGEEEPPEGSPHAMPVEEDERPAMA